MKSIIKWFNSLLSSDNEVSSKRLILLISLVLFVVYCVVSLFGIVVNIDVYDGILYLIIAASGLTVIEKFRKKDNIG